MQKFIERNIFSFINCFVVVVVDSRYSHKYIPSVISKSGKNHLEAQKFTHPPYSRNLVELGNAHQLTYFLQPLFYILLIIPLYREESVVPSVLVFLIPQSSYSSFLMTFFCIDTNLQQGQSLQTCKLHIPEKRIVQVQEKKKVSG